MENTKQAAAAQCVESVHTARHLLLRVWQSPVLLAYLAVGIVATFVQNGFKGLSYTLFDFVILGAFAVLIRRMTAGKKAEPLPVKRPRIELIVGLAIYLFLFFEFFLFWKLTNIPVLQAGMNRLNDTLYAAAVVLCGSGPLCWASEDMGNAFVSIVIELIPALLPFLIFGYFPRGIGLRPYGKLTLTLLAVMAFFGLFNMRYTALYSTILPHTLELFVIQLFINGLPEELFFRGYLLPRLERALKSPVNALILSALLFNASHIPSHLAQGEGWSAALLGVFNLMCPTGLLWGYLYQRTRSIVPGVLFHTASTNILGWFFLCM